VLGSQFVLIAGNYDVAFALWGMATALWIVMIYGIFAAFSVKDHKPSLADGINGSWLLAVVATQSIAVLSALIAAHWPQPYRLELNFLALSMWLWGGMLYIWMIALIFYRYTFFDFSPGDLSPAYWINMGAMAISALAGSLLITNAPSAPYLRSLLPFLKGFTVFYWATGTWWIPMLVILGVWRYVFRRFPLHYDPLYWGAVFPVGMYAVATLQMARAMDLGFLGWIPRCFVYLAILGWAATFIGFAATMARSLIAWAVG
jgi:tellurite resistance protein TehA-like permease